MKTATATAIKPPADFAVEKIRADFPALHQKVHGRPLVYLDNAASAQKPQAVIDAISDYYRRDHANVHRGVHTLSQRATDAYEGAREKVRAWINAASSCECIYVSGATEGVNLVAQAYARPRLKSGDEIVATISEHHSNIVPWQMVCEQTGAVLRAIPVQDNGELDLRAAAELIGGRTRIVAFGHISNALGTVNPVAELTAMARAAGAVTVVDGAQAMPHLRVDVRALDCDFYTFSGHKMYGPTGSGILYGKEALLDSMAPYRGGGEMIKSVSFAGTVYHDLPHKFEAGTPFIAGAVGLGATVDYLGGIGMEQVAAHESAVLDYALARAADTPGLTVIGRPRQRAAILSFTMDGVHPHDIGTVLDHEGVAVRTGHHCAQPLMQRFGIAATARASFGMYNTRAEVDALFAAVGKVREMF